MSVHPLRINIFSDRRIELKRERRETNREKNTILRRLEKNSFEEVTKITACKHTKR